VSSGDARAALEAARARHRERSSAGRLATVAAGWLVAGIGLLAILPLPEVGLPLLLLGLRLLALRYDWAARAYLPVARLWERLKALPGWAKITVALVCAALVVGLIWWLV
jgi:hypothetical protein